MFYLRHFKNFESAELDYEQPVTLLVGPNGAGKSNLIEAIELLAFLTAGRPLHEITDLGREGGLEVRGGLDACATFGHDTFTLGHRSIIETEEGKREAHYEISVRVEKEPRIIAEFLKIEGRDVPVFELETWDEPSASADNPVNYDNYAPGTSMSVTTVAAHRSALSQYARFALDNRRLSATLRIVDAVQSALTAPAVFDPNPKLMRDYERNTEARLARNGSNLSAVLHQLGTVELVPERTSDGEFAVDELGRLKTKRVSKQNIRERILARTRQLPDEPFDSFTFFGTDTGDVMFGFKTPHSEQPITAKLLSDGTLRALAILAALETSPAGTRLILEEFDNGVHPSRVHILAEALFDCAVRNKLRVVATTQNPATLNALTDEQFDSVLLVVHQAGEKSARLLPLSELPGYIEFMEQGRLGDLVTRRIYERHLQPDYEGERKKKMEEWLQTLP